MAIKDWRGDAVAVAQVDRLTPALVEVGDVFGVTCNGKTESIVAVAATVASVLAQMVAAINDTDIPELQEVFAEASGTSSLLLTARTPGVPFTLTPSASNGGSGGVLITTTTQGGPAASSVQAFTIPSGATGTFTVSFGGAATPGQAVGVAAATLQTAIQALATVGAGNVTVVRTSNAWAQSSFIYTCTFAGPLANQGVALLVVKLQNASPIINVEIAGGEFGFPLKNELVRVLMPDSDVSAFTFNLTFSGETSINRNYTSGSLILGTLTDWPSAIAVTKTYLGGNLYTLEFVGFLAAVNVTAVTSSSTWSAAQGTFYIPVTETTVGRPAASEVQVITLTSTPTGGTFPLSFSGQTTSAIAWNASAATVDTALEALANIGAGNLSVTGSAGGPWTVTFAGALANTNVAQMTGDSTNLTGGVVQTFVLSSVVASSGPNHYDEPKNWLPVGVPITGDDVRFLSAGEDCLYGLNQTGVVLAFLRVSQAWQNRRLGLPRVNQGGYLEYRTQFLTLGATSLVIGSGIGSGPSRVYLNTLANATALQMIDSGGSSDSLPAVQWTGTHVSNSVVISAGDFGTPPITGLEAVLDSLTMFGGGCVLHNTAILNTLRSNREQFRAYGCTLGTKVLEI